MLLLLLWSWLTVVTVLLLLLVRSNVIAHRHRLECWLLGCRLLVGLSVGLHCAERVHSGQTLAGILLLLWLSIRLLRVVELSEPSKLGVIAA